MYRALALKAIEHDTSFDDEGALVKLADGSQYPPRTDHWRKSHPARRKRCFVAHSRARCYRRASRVSVHPKVRQWMVSHQRAMGAGGGVVMEGRDIGTKVFPDADLKIFLDADPVVREQRRMAAAENSRGSRGERGGRPARARPARSHAGGVSAGSGGRCGGHQFYGDE